MSGPTDNHSVVVVVFTRSQSVPPRSLACPARLSRPLRLTSIASTVYTEYSRPLASIMVVMTNVLACVLQVPSKTLSGRPTAAFDYICPINARE